MTTSNYLPPEAEKSTLGITSKCHRGTEGDYTGVFVLGIPGSDTFQFDVPSAEIMETGDSQLHIGSEPLLISIENTGDIFHLRLEPNSAGRLSRIITSSKAVDVYEAQGILETLNAQILSNLSFTHNVALALRLSVIIERRTGTKRLRFYLQGVDRGLDHIAFKNIATTDPRFRILLGFYRQGLNSIDPFLQLICFYKVIEGIKSYPPFRNICNEIRSPIDLSTITDVDPETLNFFEEVKGKKLFALFDIYRKKYRNLVSHVSLVSEADFFDPDYFPDLRQCEIGIPVIRFLARNCLARISTIHPSEEHPDSFPITRDVPRPND